MAEVIVGKASEERLAVFEDKTQVYGLKGNDTISSNGKSDVLLIGGSGDDVLNMTGGNGTLSGGQGSDTFNLFYSAEKPISAVIEDIDPANDQIIITYDGSAAPQLNSVVSGNDVIWTDSEGYFNLTLKSSTDASDYFDGTAHEYIWDILRITNQERENQGLSPLVLSQDLTDAAMIRSEEIIENYAHTRPDGSSCFTAVTKSYWSMGENIYSSPSSPEAAMIGWMNSTGHRANILNSSFKKLGVGYTYDGDSQWKYHWVQMFGGGLTNPDTLSASTILTTPITAINGTLPEDDTPTVNTVIDSDNSNIRRGGTYTIAEGFTGVIRINTTEAVTIDGASAGNLSNVQIATFAETADLTIKNLNVVNSSGSVIAFGSGTDNKLTITGTSKLTTSDTWAAVVNIGGGLTVDGTGSLSVTAGSQGSGIGFKSYGETSADITINDGIITTSTNMGAGIGSGCNGSIGNIKILGGKLTTDSKWGAGVGAGYGGSAGNVLINGGSGNDSFSINGDYATISGGKGTDLLFNKGGANVLFNYTLGDGNDYIEGFRADSTLSISGGTYSTTKSGSDIIVTVGDGKITLQGAANLSTLNIETTINPIMTLDNSSAAKVTLGAGVTTADASARTKSINITGNELDNSIVGGKVADTLSGGAGNDTLTGGWKGDLFIYTAGNDVITDYNPSAGDKISIAGDGAKWFSHITSVDTSGGNVKLTFSKDANKTLTINDAANKKVVLNGATRYFADNQIISYDKKSVTLTSAFSGTFNANSYSSVNAAAVTQSVTISGGNKNGVSIVGGAKADSLVGTTGNDTLTGGYGADTYVYTGGNDVITDYAANFDRISLAGGNNAKWLSHITGVSVKNNNVTLTFGNDASKTLTLNNAAGKKVIVNGATRIFEDGKIYTADKKSSTVAGGSADGYWFDENNFGEAQLDSLMETSTADYSIGKLDTAHNLTKLTKDDFILTCNDKK